MATTRSRGSSCRRPRPDTGRELESHRGRAHHPSPDHLRSAPDPGRGLADVRERPRTGTLPMAWARNLTVRRAQRSAGGASSCSSSAAARSREPTSHPRSSSPRLEVVCVVREAVAGVFVPLESQERGRWDRPLIERGIAHLGRSATGDRMSRWHLEAGIACEHVIAPSVRETEWERVVSLYDLWLRESPGPVVALNRALAVAERDCVYEGRRAQDALAGDRRLSGIRSTGRPGPISSDAPGDRRPPGPATSAPSPSRRARPRGCPTSGGWNCSCPVPGTAVRRPPEPAQTGERRIGRQANPTP
jgi:hypothetical protein